MLTDAKVKAAKPKDKPYKLGDSGQLYLYVSPAGGRHWRMNYVAPSTQKQKTLSFGSYPTMTLAEARAARDAAKKILSAGRDPAIERRVARKEQAQSDANTFESVAEKWFELNSGWSLEKLREYRAANSDKWSWKTARHWTKKPAPWSAVHSADVLKSLESDVFPSIGSLPIRSLEARAPLLLEVLQEVEARGAIETAHRLRQRISGVFVYGIAAGLCGADPAASLGKALAKKPRSKPQPSVIDGIQKQEDRLRAIKNMLAKCEAQRCRASTKLALRFLAFTAVRSNELRFASWAEFEGIDWGNPHTPAPEALWRIPAARMKGDDERKAEEFGDHLVPLAPQAVAVLRVMWLLSAGLPYVFPGERHLHKPISENTLRALLIRAGYYQRHVPHGFRAAFSTYMNDRPLSERKDGDREVIDLMLAHVPEGKSGSETAYNRAGYMDRRRELACEYADLIGADLCDPAEHLGKPIRYAATGPGRLAA
ncbi:tyrosine-type recombinase/integrase [Sphingomonas fennica]|uniref:Integrase n=1 Tax=Edaphosphingomonas fennica TaxID=114404 RepID=A0A2T4HVU7_9SPHN|nr:integrase arm-type DNA-binding domain-containing protein [Sphingomonas fennica]PTD19929.1 integrase [Sphingomonas fennica]